MNLPETFDSDEAVVAYLHEQIRPERNVGQLQIWVPRPLTDTMLYSIVRYARTSGLRFRFFMSEKKRPGQFHVTLTRPMPHLPSAKKV